jgi:nucleotide-binding universal stress UspA family protein
MEETMTIKNILVTLRGTGSERHVASCGLALAERLKAHVTAAASLEDMGTYMDMAATYSGSGYAELQPVIEKQQNEQYERARADFGGAMVLAKVPTVDRPTCHKASAYWLDSSRYEPPITTAGRLADLIIADRPDQIAGFAIQAIENALFAVRRPVLLLPRGVHRLGKQAAVAWNGSTEAATAMHHAVDLLEPGAKVTIIQVGELSDTATPASALADYLGWHCLESETLVFEDKPKSTGQLIMTAANDAEADLLVMGAYTHSRFREMLLGGVTEQMLRGCNLPVLMAH